MTAGDRSRRRARRGRAVGVPPGGSPWPAGTERRASGASDLIVPNCSTKNVRVRSVATRTFVTPMLAGIGGEASHKYSADLSAHVKRGLEWRGEASGKPVRLIPFGYGLRGDRSGGRSKLLRAGRLEAERVVDPVAARAAGPAHVRSDRVGVDALGSTQRAERGGAAAAARKDRPDGSPWTTRAVRGVLDEPGDYTGATGYPVLIPA